MALVSVIVPVFNVERYVERCLRSVLDQTLADVEVLAVDDGSTDRSGQVLNRLSASDSRLHVFHQPNAGPAAARNCALDRATGEFVMFCDADDTYEPTTCERMAEAIRREDVDFAQCGNRWRVEEGVSEAEAAFRQNGEYANPVRTGRVALTDDGRIRLNGLLWNKIFRRGPIERFGIRFPPVRAHEDEGFVRQYAMVSESVALLSESLYVYSVRSGSLMSSYYHRRPVRREDLLTVAGFVVDFALRQGLAGRRLCFLQQMVGYHYRTCRECFANFERPDLLRKFNSLLAVLPPPRKRIVEVGGKTLMVGITVEKG